MSGPAPARVVSGAGQEALNVGGIEAIVFDVGRVLYRWQLSLLYDKLIPDPARADWFVQNVVTEDWHYQHDAGADPDVMIAERTVQFPDWADEIAAYKTDFLATIPGPVDGTHAIVDELAQAGWPLFALTNFADLFWDRFRPDAQVFDRFRTIVVSGKEKLAKPDPAIYALAQDRFGYPGEALFFIDDNLDNVSAARDCGWQAHAFVDAPTLRADLEARGLL